MNIFLFTIMNTGTRSVKKYYEDLGHEVTYMHAVPGAEKQLQQYDNRVTTVRDPRAVANSWMKGPSPRFRNCNWIEQWEMWNRVINTYDFDNFIVIEDFDGPVVGRDERPVTEVPWELEEKIQFALRVLERNGFIYYGDY